MSTAAFVLVPLLVLGGVWTLLRAYDGSLADRPRLTRICVGCLLGAVVLATVGLLVDHLHPSSPRSPSTTRQV
jgi:hypothetical protein